MSKAKESGTWGWLSDRLVFIPEKQFTTIPKTHTVEFVRGYGYTVAVIDSNNQVVGWAEKEAI